MKKATILSGTVHNNHRLLESFVSLSHYITKTLLSCLSDALKVDNYVRFENHHRDSEPSNTTLSLLHYPKNADLAEVGHNKHTDIGSLTLLFSERRGLQVVMPETKT